MSDCIFCRIAAGEIPATRVYEDEEILGFLDISPEAPVHILVIPKKHISSLNDLSPEDSALAGRMLIAAARIAGEQGIAQSGYRVLTNTGPDSGQAVDHLHFHVLGGRKLGKLG